MPKRIDSSLTASDGNSPEAGCRGKQRFDDPQMAAKIAKKQNSNGRRVRAYKCQYCHGWHIGGRDYR